MRIPFKTILFPALLSLAAFVFITFISCNRDKCKTVVCENGGVCNGGLCTCVLGYEGANCETQTRQKFLGNWHVFEKGSYTDAASYSINIDSGVNLTDVVITNFNDYFTKPVFGSVAGDSLFIYNQVLQGKYILGVGAITPNTTYAENGFMVVRYEIIDSITGIADDYGYNSVIDLSAPSNWNK